MIINKQADVGSPSCVPLSTLKYLDVIPPFMMHDSWLFKRVFIKLMLCKIRFFSKLKLKADD